MSDLVTLLHGDCLEVMPTLEAESVDAVVTDPPYGLEFMGKEWDAFRAGKNGHAGMNSGGKGSTKGLTAPQFRYTLAQWHAFQAWCEQWAREALRVTKPGGYLLAFGGTRTHHRLVCALEDAGWIIRDELDWIYASGFPKGKANLKPAHEPIVLARKPGPLRPLGIDECRIGTDGGTEGAGAGPRGDIFDQRPGSPDAGLNGPFGARVPGLGRWPSNVLLSDPELFDEPNPYVVGSGATSGGGEFVGPTERKRNLWGPLGEGSSNAPDQYGDSGGYARFFIVPKTGRAERERGLRGAEVDYDHSGPRGHTLNGDGTPRASTQARANVHPTVKPIDLMRHLVRLVTPTGGTVLDPFLGSGTTALAASEEGFSCIGIEREAEYLDIARGRLAATPIGMGL